MNDSPKRWPSFRRRPAAGVRSLPRLGPAWHIVDWVTAHEFPDPVADRFLAIGPGGVYAVLVFGHGRARVLVAGDVLQSEGRRPGYIAEARRTATEVGRHLSTVVGLPIPVKAVLVLDGSGSITVHGLPRDCLIADVSGLDRLLIAGGARISPETARKLAVAAERPA
ncbi:hypothetical protein OHA21_08095 [Actinoplanes sp. NBC_00393]|uniref:hypothetical protein n=1 Tax=Actinoplanes sp. NBC_00393 TaxID=2975953 RepID=UPI002E1DD69A